MATNKTRYMLLLVLVGLALVGCSELSLHVKLEEDGGATITERILVAGQILEQESAKPGQKSFKDMLSKDATLVRAKLMGKGASLVSHECRNTPDGGLESLAVYAIPDVNDLRLLAPFFGAAGHQDSYLKIEVGPSYSTRWASPDMPGWMYVHFSMVRQGKPDKPAPASQPAPDELQPLRELQPILKELARDCRLKVTFESYNQPWGGTAQYPHKVGARGTAEPTCLYSLIDVAGDNVDLVGRNVLDNQELMLDVARGEPAGASIAGLVESRLGTGNSRSFMHDRRLPLYFPRGLDYTVERLRFAASEFHFKKYFDGKPASEGGNVKESDDVSAQKTKPPARRGPVAGDPKRESPRLGTPPGRGAGGGVGSRTGGRSAATQPVRP